MQLSRPSFLGHPPVNRRHLAATIALLVAILTVVPIAAKQRDADHSNRGPIAIAREASKRNTKCAGEVVGYAIDGTPLCSHGEDRLHGANRRNDGRRSAAATGESAGVVSCIGDGESGNRIEVLYVHPSGSDRYAENVLQIQTWVAEMDAIFGRSAELTGGSRELRLVTSSDCRPVVRNVSVPADSLLSFGDSIRAVQSEGYQRSDRHYLMFVDATRYCGIGTIWTDDSPGTGNLNNSGGGFARVDRQCWGAVTAAHETMHTLGGVQPSAPNATRYFHCTDENDIMCYSDQGGGRPSMDYRCTEGAWARLDLFDCNSDDYFSTNPADGSYLATHWNVANSSFLRDPGANHETPGGALRIQETSVEVGSSLVVDVTGLAPAMAVTLRIDDSTVASGRTDSAGSYTFNFSMPRSTRGEHAITASDGTTTAHGTIIVTPSVSTEGVIRPGKSAAVLIDGAASGELLNVEIAGKSIGEVTADSNGYARLTFTAPRKGQRETRSIRINGNDGTSFTARLIIR